MAAIASTMPAGQWSLLPWAATCYNFRGLRLSQLFAGIGKSTTDIK